jgi:hypothetical protein
MHLYSRIAVRTTSYELDFVDLQIRRDNLEISR